MLLKLVDIDAVAATADDGATAADGAMVVSLLAVAEDDIGDVVITGKMFTLLLLLASLSDFTAKDEGANLALGSETGAGTDEVDVAVADISDARDDPGCLLSKSKTRGAAAAAGEERIVGDAAGSATGEADLDPKSKRTGTKAFEVDVDEPSFRLNRFFPSFSSPSLFVVSNLFFLVFSVADEEDLSTMLADSRRLIVFESFVSMFPAGAKEDAAADARLEEVLLLLPVMGNKGVRGEEEAFFTASSPFSLALGVKVAGFTV